mmetsp:Transcript_7335/g.12928  ORF Transcript_7335/g.12928 Transcript_7335/m.12928 type:complete len:130 (-) Transcript_7335:320-709(-)
MQRAVRRSVGHWPRLLLLFRMALAVQVLALGQDPTKAQMTLKEKDPHRALRSPVPYFPRLPLLFQMTLLVQISALVQSPTMPEMMMKKTAMQVRPKVAYTTNQVERFEVIVYKMAIILSGPRPLRSSRR